MKKRLNILPLVAIAFVAVFVFSGCGKILELMYPDQTGGGGGGENKYGVTLRVNIPTSVTDWGMKQMVVRLESVSDSTFAAQQRTGMAYAPAGSDTATWVVSFDYLPSGSYKVFAWLDTTADLVFDPATEPSAGRDTFGLPYTDPFNGNTMDRAEFPVDLVPVSSNSVTLKLYIDTVSFANWLTEDLVMGLTQMEGKYLPSPTVHGSATAVAATSTDYIGDDKALWKFTYENIPDGTYKMAAWVDANHNSVWERTEPGAEVGAAVITDHGEVFPVPYYYPWDTTTKFNPEFALTLFAVDPTFSMSGPASVDTAAPTMSTLYLYPASTSHSISSVFYKITDDSAERNVDQMWDPNVVDEWGYTVGGWVDSRQAYDTYMAGAEGFSFDIDWNTLYYWLGDEGFWGDNAAAVVQVTMNYDDDTSYVAEYSITLASSSGGTYYDLVVETDYSDTAPYGYAYVYVTDWDDGSTLAYNSAYLDADGYYPFTFYGIYDPTGKDQSVQIYVYDQYWNYVGYYTYYVGGTMDSSWRGSYNLTAQDWGSFTADW